MEVPDRTQIKIHVGNGIDSTEGCLLLGEIKGFFDGTFGVGRSQRAHAAFMAAMDGIDETRIHFYCSGEFA